jgi:hypothetical protein
LVELDDVTRGIGDEGLTVLTDREGIPDHEALRTQLLHHSIEIGDLHCEVLADIRQSGRFDQMDLLGADVDPCPGNTEVRPVAPEGSPQHAGVEGDGLVDVRDVESDVVDAQWVHRDKSSRSNRQLHEAVTLSRP